MCMYVPRCVRSHPVRTEAANNGQAFPPISTRACPGVVNSVQVMSLWVFGGMGGVWLREI